VRLTYKQLEGQLPYLSDLEFFLSKVFMLYDPWEECKEEMADDLARGHAILLDIVLTSNSLASAHWKIEQYVHMFLLSLPEHELKVLTGEYEIKSTLFGRSSDDDNGRSPRGIAEYSMLSKIFKSVQEEREFWSVIANSDEVEPEDEVQDSLNLNDVDRIRLLQVSGALDKLIDFAGSQKNAGRVLKEFGIVSRTENVLQSYINGIKNDTRPKNSPLFISALSKWGVSIPDPSNLSDK